MLEVIDKGSCSEEHPVPLLFVHGAWHAAWCWDEHFLDYFADKGYRALAVSLRGHGNSPAPRRKQTCSVADFVNDVDSVANSLPMRPVVIGHSLGGFVVQKYLEAHDAPAGVLVASMPTRGAGGFLLRGMKRHPWHAIRGTVTTRSLHGYNTPKLAREYFYSPHTRVRCGPLCRTTRRRVRWENHAGHGSTRSAQARAGHYAAPGLRCRMRRLLHTGGNPRDRACLPHRSRNLPEHGSQHDGRARVGNRCSTNPHLARNACPCKTVQSIGRASCRPVNTSLG